MTKKTKQRLPYVGEAERGLFAADEVYLAQRALPEIPVSFKTFNDHACSVCECPFAPFGVGYPETTRWFCRKHIGGYMPEVTEAFDRNRLREVARLANSGARYWLDLQTAALNGDADGCRGIWKRIRDTSVQASDLLKALGTEGSQGGQNG